jgi:hypothetical protein
VRAIEPAADLPAAGRGNLYILVEVTGSGGGHAALYRQLLTAAQTAYYEATGSVSASLSRAVRAAHAALVHANEALSEAGWRAGISCVVYQGNELIIAQAGPALVMVSHPKTIDQYPARSGPAGAALGGPDRPEVELYRTTVEPGSLLLMAQSDWLNSVRPESLAAVAGAESPRQAQEYLGQLAGAAELSALLIGFSVPIPAVKDDVYPVAAPPPARASGVDTPAIATAAAGPVARPSPAPVKPPPASAASNVPVETPPQATPALASDLEPAVVTDERGRRSPWGLVLALIVIPVVVIGLVLAMLWFRTQNAEAQFQQTLAGAQTAVTEAQGLTDEGQARLRLSSAHDFLEKARALRPNDAQLAKVQASYSEIIGRINRITPLYGLLELWQFRESGRKLDRILVGGDSLYVLDRGRSEVLRFILSKLGDSATPAQPTEVIRKGQAVGDAAVSDLVDSDWVVASGNQRSRLLALDSAGGLVGYDITWGAARLPLAAKEKLGLPQLAKSFGGNLYVVDTKNGQIWRYRPGDKGFENPPEPYFAPNTKVDLSGVQSMDIDGHVWLLFADGRLLKFFGGEQKPFELKALPDPLSAPAAIAAQADGDLIYLADSGNGRILEFTKDGQFQRQFRPAQGNSLQGIRDLYLDETGDKFYIVTADKLWKADVPRVPSSNKAAPSK